MDVKKKMFQLAIPTIIENILQTTLASVDTYFVAGIGSIAVSAVGLNSLITNLYLTFFIAIGTGISIFTGRSFGEKNKEKTNQYICNGFFLHLILNLFILLLNLLFGHPILTFLAKDIRLISPSYSYFLVVNLPIFGLATMTVISSILKSLGDTKTSMYTILLINLFNILLDYILICGIGTFKGIGLLGAGIATTVSRFIGCIILIIALEKKTHFMVSFCIRTFKKNRYMTQKEMVCYAIPIGLEKLSMRVGQLVYGSLIVRIGITHYTAHNIAGTIEAYSYLPAMGFGVAAFTLSSHAIGEKNEHCIRKIGTLSYKYSTFVMVCIGFVFYLFAPELASFFTKDPAVKTLVIHVLRLIAFFQPALASTQVIPSVLQALGDVKYPFYLTTVGIWCIRIVGTYLLGIYLNLGLFGVWIAYCVDISIRGILLYHRFLQKTSIPY